MIPEYTYYRSYIIGTYLITTQPTHIIYLHNLFLYTSTVLPALDFLQAYPVVGQELLVDHVQGQVDGRPAPFQVERRVQFSGH